MIKKKYPINKPKLKKMLNCIGLLSSSNLQVTISRSAFLCLREDLKEKSGRLKDFCVPVSPLHFLFSSFFFFKRARTNSFV